MIELRADKSHLVVLRREYVTSGSHRVYDVQFRFSHDWDGLTKLVLFRVGKNEPTAPILLPLTDRCQIPTDILYESGKMLYIGVMGVANDFAIPEDITSLISPRNNEEEIPSESPPCGCEEEKPDPIVLPTMWCPYDIVRRGVQSEQIGIGEAITEIGAIRDDTVTSANAAQADAERSEEAADRAENAVLHPPIIDEETDNWMLWNFTKKEYVVTEFPSKGDQGDKGDPGQNGSNGLSAYEVALMNGFIGTENEWLESLKQGSVGAKGDKGDKGDPGAKGDKGDKGDPSPEYQAGEGINIKDDVISSKIPIKYLSQNEYNNLVEKDPNTLYVTPSGGQGTGEGNYEVYSNEEILIGEWFGKPLYRKGFLITSPSGINVNGTIVNLDLTIEVVRIYGYIHDSNPGYSIVPFPFLWANNAFVSIWCQTSTIMMRVTNTSYTNKPGVAIIEYTKTTDETGELELSPPERSVFALMKSLEFTNTSCSPSGAVSD